MQGIELLNIELHKLMSELCDTDIMPFVAWRHYVVVNYFNCAKIPHMNI